MNTKQKDNSDNMRNTTAVKRRPTMMDVAALAAVSQTTVSLILNDAAGARLSGQTRQAVFAAAKSLGYQMVKRGGAQAEAASPTVIGFVADELSTDPWCAIALDGIREKAWEHGLTVSVALTRSDVEMEQAVHAQMAAQPLLGLIYGSIQTRQIPVTAALTRIPTVLLNCHVADRSIAAILPGEVIGGRTATERLIAGGHRRIGMVEGEVWMEASRERLKGYRQALASHDIVFDPALVRPGNWEPSAGFEQTLALMRLADPPTAIFCANDLMAMGCYDALRELGKRIPDDVAVMGYDDREIAQFMRPPLTTIVLPLFDMGARAAEYIIDFAAGPKQRPAQIKVECPLVERGSVGTIITP
jgi:LacI family transcriptional regulator